MATGPDPGSQLQTAGATIVPSRSHDRATIVGREREGENTFFHLVLVRSHLRELVTTGGLSHTTLWCREGVLYLCAQFVLWMPRGSTDKVGRVCVTRPIDGPTAAESDLTLRSRVVDVLGEEERKKKRVSLLYYGTDCGVLLERRERCCVPSVKLVVGG